MITPEEVDRLLALPKRGEPTLQWRQDAGHRYAAFNEFGVVDEQGASMRGLQVTLEVYRPPRLAFERYKLTLFFSEFGIPERIYQMDVNGNPRLRVGDHAYSHVHRGASRIPLPPDAAQLTFNEALRRFCQACNLTLDEAVPPIDTLDLR